MQIVEPDPYSVVDQETFFLFAQALIEDRAAADDALAANPDQFNYASVHGWENGSIADYLGSAVAGVLSQRDGWGSLNGVSWRELAVFLWLGKIYE